MRAGMGSFTKRRIDQCERRVKKGVEDDRGGKTNSGRHKTTAKRGTR